MYIPSDKYKEALDNINRNPKSKVIIDGIEYTGMDRIKDHPSITQEATNFIGEFPTKECKFSLFNRDASLKIINKDVQVFRGLVLNDGTVEYIPQGVFHINTEDVTTNSTAKTIELTIKDKSTVFDCTYGGEGNITYPCTLGDFINEIVTRRGFVLETPDFPMSSFVLESAPNFDKTITTERSLIASAAMLGGCTAQMSRTGGVCISRPYDTGNEIKRMHYQSLASKEEKFGPINSVILGRSNGDNDVVAKDEESIKLNGLCEWRIEDNPYVDLIRETCIDEVAIELFGREIIPFEINNLIDSYLYDINDMITIQDKQGNTFSTILMSIQSTSRIFTKIKTAVQNKTSTNYKLAGSSRATMEKIKLDVDHNKQEIEAQAIKITENQEQIAQTIMNIEAIQNLFQITGGVNLIKNSVGLFGDNYWTQSESGSFSFGEDSDLMGITTSSSKISISNGTLTSTSINIKGLTIDTIKSFNFKIRQDEDVTTIVTLYGLSEDYPAYKKTFTGAIDWQDIYKDEECKFFVDSPDLTLKIESTATYDGVVEISDLMLNDGEKQQWQPANGEIWGTIIKMSQQGISCYSVEGGYITMMTTQGFQVRELHGSSIGDVISKFTNLGIETNDITQTGKHIQIDLVHDMIESNGNEVYIEYIKG